MNARRIPRHLKFSLLALAVGFAITVGLFVDIVGRIRTMQDKEVVEADPFNPPLPPLYSLKDPQMQVKIFFPGTQDNAVLSAEDQTIFRSTEVTNRALQILQKLLEGPKTEGLYPSIPKDTKVQAVFIDQAGLAYVDFSNSISTNHPGGMLNEQATLYSIVNSLTFNLPEIRQVKVLVGGVETETLAGHCLLVPLAMDLSITNVTQPQEPKPNAE